MLTFPLRGLTETESAHLFCLLMEYVHFTRKRSQLPDEVGQEANIYKYFPVDPMGCQLARALFRHFPTCDECRQFENAALHASEQLDQYERPQFPLTDEEKAEWNTQIDAIESGYGFQLDSLRQSVNQPFDPGDPLWLLNQEERFALRYLQGLQAFRKHIDACTDTSIV